MVNMVPVISSNLSSVGYEESTRTLYIEFHHGGVYAYYDVPSTIYNDLMNADSKGHYHAVNIKNVFRYKKL